jgi:hypothetical protein
MGGPGLLVILCGAVLSGLPGRASAGTPAPEGGSAFSRIFVFGDVGYAYPMGSAETGTDTRDVSFGLVPLTVGGSYDVARGWNVDGRLRYAPNIPTLCASGPDCEASLGHDIALAVGVGRSLPGWWRFTPHVAVEVGWEWLTTRLSDSGVTASRSWNGPIAAVDAFVDLKTDGPWMIGPAVRLEAGFFSHSALETPAGPSSGSAGAAIHAWPTISFRLGRRL